jgi:site-specific DNA recombinase
MLEAAGKRAFRVIYIWNISRLARESAISIPMIKDFVHNQGIRIICSK